MKTKKETTKTIFAGIFLIALVYLASAAQQLNINFLQWSIVTLIVNGIAYGIIIALTILECTIDLGDYE